MIKGLVWYGRLVFLKLICLLFCFLLGRARLLCMLAVVLVHDCLLHPLLVEWRAAVLRIRQRHQLLDEPRQRQRPECVLVSECLPAVLDWLWIGKLLVLGLHLLHRACRHQQNVVTHVQCALLLFDPSSVSSPRTSHGDACCAALRVGIGKSELLVYA